MALVFRLAPYAVIAALLIVGLWYRGQYLDAQAQAAAVKVQYDLVVKVNEANVKALDQLTKARALDAETVADLTGAADKINNAADELTEARSELELTNADVRAYLVSPIPSDLKRLYK